MAGRNTLPLWLGLAGCPPKRGLATGPGDRRGEVRTLTAAVVTSMLLLVELDGGIRDLKALVAERFEELSVRLQRRLARRLRDVDCRRAVLAERYDALVGERGDPWADAQSGFIDGVRAVQEVYDAAVSEYIRSR
jgi:hypothetical protein